MIGRDRRGWLLWLTWSAWWLGCGGGGGGTASSGHGAGTAMLSAADVTAIVERSAASVDVTSMVIAVTDRAGRVLGVFAQPQPVQTFGNFGEEIPPDELAIALARTGAFFSNNQAPLSSRTVRFISGIHFPPGIPNTPNAALYGIENTNRGCDLNIVYLPGQGVAPARSYPESFPCDALDQTGCGYGIQTGKADLTDSDPGAVNPGGVPIFKDGQVVGGIGVVGASMSLVEFAAFQGSLAGPQFGPRVASPGVIFIDGVTLPFVQQTTQPPGTSHGTTDGQWLVAPTDGGTVPEGWLAGPTASPALNSDNVRMIIEQGIDRANHTRAAIRLPIGSTAKMVLAVGDLDGNILGLYRMSDSTVFSIDVAVAKARNVVYFSGPSRTPDELPGVAMSTAITNRTINFGSQPLYPPGIDVERAPELGPFFDSLYVPDVAHPCSQGRQPASANQNGIVFFAGSVPLYRSGRLVGGLGVSGDGVEQDDVVAAGGARGFEAPEAIRADQVFVRGVRLPYLKFDRNPEVP